MRVKRGEIYMANLDPVMGSEQGGTRPVLIVQNDLGNRYSKTVIAVPLTSRVGKNPLRTHVMIVPPDGGVRCASLALCEQVRTMEKTRLRQRMGMLSQNKLRMVGEALAIALGADGDDGRSQQPDEKEAPPEQGT